MASDPIREQLRVAELLDQIGVPYLVGGSMANSLLGEPRSTVDIDVAVQLRGADVGNLISALQPEFYVDEDVARRAVEVQAGRLELSYLRRWAVELGLAALFERALGEAGVSGS